MIVAAGLLGTVATAQNRAISGTVVDESGAPVIGAAVVVVGNASIGAVTDANGNFRLNVPAGANINVSCIGYADQTVAVGNQTTFRFVLVEDTEFIDETVVIGYGVQRKSDLTGSVASVGADDIKNLSTTDAASALQGKAAGVQILNYSGAPGEGAAIRVRGYSSNSGNIGPLLIVDGLKVDNIQYLDPSMIQSIEILKDAASAAIYGAEAGNGVVLVTTKQGQDGTGSITYSYKLTTSSLAKKPGVMNRAQFIDFKRMQGFNIDQQLQENGDDGKIDTDWADALFERGMAHQHSLTFQGGNNRGHYLLALNYFTNNGMIVGDKDTYQRLSAQINADYKIKEWLTVGTNTSIEKWARNSISQMSETNSVMMSVIQNDPLTPLYYDRIEDMPLNMRLTAQGTCPEPGMGDFYGPDLLVRPNDTQWYAVSKYVDNDHGSPLIQLARRRGTGGGMSVRGTMFGNFNIFKGFVFTTRLGYRISYSNNHDYSTPYYANPMALSKTYSISASANTGLYYQWENFFNYNVNLGKHALGAMAGMSFIENRSDNVSANASGPDILSGYEPNFIYMNYVNSQSSTTKGFSNAPGRSANLSYFARLMWSYDNRYSLQGNFRADAFDSSKLPADKRWGFFPSVSAGWTVSNEPFFRDNISREAVSFLKFRASWGVNGNINVLNNYPYSTSINYNAAWYQYALNDNTADYGSYPTGLANPDLKWETSEQLDLGLDARFLNNRLTLGIDYYNKNTRDLLVNIQPVIEIGVGSTTVNGGNVNNQGLEFELGWKDRIGELGYSINANFSTLKNKVTYLDPAITRILYGSYYVSQFRTAFETGYPIWFMYGYKVDSINPEDGSYKLVDVNGDGVVSSGDMTYIGKGIPDYNYGVTIALDWRGFDLNIFGTGVGGNNIFPVLYRTDRPYNNTLEFYHANSWSPSNKNARFPDPSKVANDTMFWASDANIFDGSFFKIKQIQLGYTLPQRITQKVAIQNLRVFASMDDWFTFTKYPGLDPETATTTNAQQLGVDLGSYPMAKKLIFGVNVTF